MEKKVLFTALLVCCNSQQEYTTSVAISFDMHHFQSSHLFLRYNDNSTSPPSVKNSLYGFFEGHDHCLRICSGLSRLPEVLVRKFQYGGSTDRICPRHSVYCVDSLSVSASGSGELSSFVLSATLHRPSSFFFIFATDISTHCAHCILSFHMFVLLHPIVQRCTHSDTLSPAA